MVKNNKFLVGNQQPSSFRNGGEGSETIESNLSNNNFMDEISYMMKSELSPSGSMWPAPYLYDMNKDEDIVQTVEKFTDCLVIYGGIWLATSKRKDFLVQSLPSTLNTLGGMKMNSRYHVCPFCNESIFSRVFGFHLEEQHNMTLEEYYCTYVNPEASKTCFCCGVGLKFTNLYRGYGKHCSDKCAKKTTEKDRIKTLKNNLATDPTIPSRGGKAVHEKYPGHAGRMRALAVALNPKMLSDAGKTGGVTTQRLYPMMAYEQGKKKHKECPEFFREMGKLGRKAVNESRCPETGLFPMEKRLVDDPEFLSLGLIYGKGKGVTHEDICIFPDFVRHDYKYVVELDGSWHKEEEVKKNDKRKDEIYTACGYFVRRIDTTKIKESVDMIKIIKEDLNKLNKALK